MIPKRIKLSGFLCYRDEQEIAFNGSALWMLAGLNGSGKSSVFDAVTYALFGHHRGGSTGAADLITKGENSFSLEFDFTLDGQLYQAKRTLKKRATTTATSQQLSVWQGENGSGRWLPVADTHMKAKYDEWVRDHIGLNYETFTSSVLLLQGKAEKLLDSTAKGRAEVLASIVDLERYQKLHERADAKRKDLKWQVEAFAAQFNAIPEATPLELAAAAGRIEDAEEALAAAQKETDRLQTAEFQARQWSEVQKKLAAAQLRRQQAGALVQEAAVIDKELARLRELRDVLPHVETVVLNRTALARSQEETKILTGMLRETQDKLSQREFDVQEARRKRENHQAKIAEYEAKQQEIGKKLPPLSALLERVKQLDQRREDAERLERDSAALPADLPKRVADGQTIVDELTGLHHTLAPLSRFAQLRGELTSARDHLQSAQAREKTVQAKGEEIRAKLDGLRPEVEAAKAALLVVQEKLASEKTLLKQAADQDDEFDTLEGAKVCRTCGQALTPRHHAEEKARREKERAAAEARVKQVTAEWKAAQARERELGKQYADLEHEIQTARDEFKDARTAAQQAHKDVTRLSGDCATVYGELPVGYRARVAAEPPADWLATTYPTPADLESARRTASGLATAKRDLEKKRDDLTRWNTLSAQLAVAKQALADLAATLTADPAALRRQFHDLEAGAKSIADELKTLKQLDRAAGTEVEKLATECQQMRESATERNGKLQTESEKQKMSQQAIAGARKALPPDWQAHADRMALAEWNRLRSDKDELEKKGVEARANELRQARIELESLKQTIAGLERERDQFPEEARRDPAVVQAELKQARATLTAKSDDLNSARNERANLEERGQRRKALRTQLDASEKELNRYKLLAELLGRDRLQRHLVRQAERQIVDYANGVLDRLSGGQLMLRLCGGDDAAGADKALELECYNRATGQSPINVAFLSGSQRFRVAVSLALGIGQYASRQHRPIESVIIDEGFGCLDRNGRQVMIQELQNLRGHLHCILLVSHQEEFADAFADGYRFELNDGSTKVTRFQR
jgi:exonuclease SbcC